MAACDPRAHAARRSCTTAPARTWRAASPPRWRRPRGAAAASSTASSGCSRSTSSGSAPVVEELAAARAAARQPVPRPARPLRRARDHRRALGRTSSARAPAPRARAERRRPAGRRPRPRREALYFGVDDDSLALAELQHAADSKHCRRCGHPYAYEAIYLAHLGRYALPELRRAAARAGRGGARRRAARDPLGGVHAARAGRAARASSCRCPGSTTSTTRSAPPRCAWRSARRSTTVVAGLEAVAPAFGRAETLELGGRPTSILLVKNPAGANEVLRTLALEGEQLDLFGVLNDNTADGRDVSWVWDADWELLAPHVRRMTCSGTRAAELALRLKYAGVDAGAARGRARARGRAGPRARRRRRAALRAADLHRAARAARPARRAAAQVKGHWR